MARSYTVQVQPVIERAIEALPAETDIGGYIGVFIDLIELPRVFVLADERLAIKVIE